MISAVFNGTPSSVVVPAAMAGRVIIFYLVHVARG